MVVVVVVVVVIASFDPRFSSGQVDCLVEQATDPNILGRTWIGWSPWL